MEHEIGNHHLVEYSDCDPERIKYVATLEPILREAVRRTGAVMVGELSHQFEPCGATCMILIEESHVTIHTWPEKEYAALDIFTCGDMDTRAAIDYVARELRSGHYETTRVSRGMEMSVSR